MRADTLQAALQVLRALPPAPQKSSLGQAAAEVHFYPVLTHAAAVGPLLSEQFSLYSCFFLL